MISVPEAAQRIQQAIRALGEQAVRIDDALGRYLAAPIEATRQLPPWDNSAMDGFAVRAAELPATLPVTGTIAAGDPPGTPLAPGSALRIMTGAPVPAGADAVVMREEVQDDGERAAFSSPAPVGDNIRRAGEDVALGDRVLEAGARLGPAELGLCAALGYATVRCHRRPRVAVLSTGDELVDVSVEPRPGQIVNSNAYALAAQIREAGGEPVHCGIAPDDREGLRHELAAALDAGDVLVTSGGVSVGDYDYVKEVFGALGVELDFWKVAMKPGKPLAFGVTRKGVPVFGLPGNPVSSMVVFELFARPALLAMQGARECERPRVRVTLAEPYAKQAGRAHYVRASLRRDGDALVATPNARQGSGMLRSMVGVHALVELEAERGDVAAGERLDAILLSPV